jgi:hypothetical protein
VRSRRLALALAAALGATSLVTAAGGSGATVVRGSAAAATPTYVNYTPNDLPQTDPLHTTKLGYDAGEPSIGVNHKTGKVMYQAVLQTLQVSFDDSKVPATVTYKDVTNPVEGVTTLDPFLFTDSVTGRTWVSQLVPPCSVTSFTDTDGESAVAGLPTAAAWTPSTGCGVGSNFDHQTVSAGPAPAGLPTTYGPNRAVYYCSQVVVQATCSRSLDGGITFPQSGVLYTDTGSGPSCGGLHGHLRIAPDGTAYMPNFRCNVGDGGDRAALVVADPGPVLQFEIRPLPPGTTTPDFDSDPAVGIDSAGTAYMVWEGADNNIRVAVTKDRGLTYTDIQDVGLPFAIKNGTMPKAVGGSPGRAAVTFLGTPTEAPLDNNGFRENNLRSFDPDQGDPKGGWHLYVAHTYDYGKNWVTVDVTPTDPVQRGCIWWGNVAAADVPEGDRSCSSNPERNLLDFIDMTVDESGRVLVGYADGCVGPCAKDASSTTKDDNAVIARQTCGRGLYAQLDGAADGPLRACRTSVPRAMTPPVSGTVGGGTVTPAAPEGGALPTTGLPPIAPVAGAMALGVAAFGLRRRET